MTFDIFFVMDNFSSLSVFVFASFSFLESLLLATGLRPCSCGTDNDDGRDTSDDDEDDTSCIPPAMIRLGAAGARMLCCPPEEFAPEELTFNDSSWPEDSLRVKSESPGDAMR